MVRCRLSRSARSVSAACLLSERSRSACSRSRSACSRSEATSARKVLRASLIAASSARNWFRSFDPRSQTNWATTSMKSRSLSFSRLATCFLISTSMSWDDGNDVVGVGSVTVVLKTNFGTARRRSSSSCWSRCAISWQSGLRHSLVGPYLYSLATACVTHSRRASTQPLWRLEYRARSCERRSMVCGRARGRNADPTARWTGPVRIRARAWYEMLCHAVYRR